MPRILRSISSSQVIDRPGREGETTMKQKSMELFEGFLNTGIRYFKWVILAALAIILLTGIYKVDSSEVAVVLRFGALTGATPEEQIKQPGLHFSLPSFIDEVVKVPVERVQVLSVGSLYGSGSLMGKAIQSNGYVITGDSNIVRMNIAVKYKISDPVAYALRVGNISEALQGIVSGEITALVSGTTVDDVLTTEKSTLISKTMKNAQAVIDRVGLGVTITNVELTEIAPPSEALEAFNNATTASVCKHTLIQQARDYEESTIPDAQAQAQKLIADANSAQADKVAKATAISEQFMALYEQYKRNPSVVYNGVFRTRVSEVLKQSGATIVVPETGGKGTRLILPNTGTAQ